MKIDRSIVELDEFDRKIVSILGRDGRITYTDLAQRV
jgi:Lrp/AsnC family leucine-responsive transcriptional regulator